MSSFVLKIIACVLMLIDHLTLVLCQNTPMLAQIDFSNTAPELLTQAALHTFGRGLGRLAFPIFCFLLVEGLRHTRSVKKYLLRLGILALVTEVPFDLMIYRMPFNMSGQNVLWTLLLGLSAIAVIDAVKRYWPNDMTKYNLFSCMAIMVFGFAAMILATDYSIFGVMLIITTYMFRDKKFWMAIMFLILAWIFRSLFAIPEYAGVLAYPLFIFLYNGKKGINDRYLLYAFYPVHMLILGLLSIFVL